MNTVTRCGLAVCLCVIAVGILVLLEAMTVLVNPIILEVAALSFGIGLLCLILGDE